jgi:crotonobetainyl-CoA:carnitine CoA-transferase CaiB-like acyl-CoA transferase
MNRNITYPGAPYQFDETPWQVRRCAPSIGQDNTDVLKGELGMPEKELAVLAEMGII